MYLKLETRPPNPKLVQKKLDSLAVPQIWTSLKASTELLFRILTRVKVCLDFLKFPLRRKRAICKFPTFEYISSLGDEEAKMLKKRLRSVSSLARLRLLRRRDDFLIGHSGALMGVRVPLLSICYYFCHR